MARIWDLRHRVDPAGGAARRPPAPAAVLPVLPPARLAVVPPACPPPVRLRVVPPACPPSAWLPVVPPACPPPVRLLAAPTAGLLAMPGGTALLAPKTILGYLLLVTGPAILVLTRRWRTPGARHVRHPLPARTGATPVAPPHPPVRPDRLSPVRPDRLSPAAPVRRDRPAPAASGRPDRLVAPGGYRGPEPPPIRVLPDRLPLAPAVRRPAHEPGVYVGRARVGPAPGTVPGNPG